MNEHMETARLLPVTDELTPREQRGRVIAETREGLGYSRRALADLLPHISRDTLTKIEQGAASVGEGKIEYVEAWLRKKQRAEDLDEEMGALDEDDDLAPRPLVKFSIEKHHIKLNFECPPEDLDETTEAAYRLAEHLGLTDLDQGDDS